MSTKNEFYVTRDLFREYTHFNKPLTYVEWMEVPDDSKAAVLYLQFFEQITLAWYKMKSVYSVEADGVAEVLQYLQKNVEKIKNDEKRFTPAYIYRVCSNCLYCLCRDPNRYKRAYENECSNIIRYGDEDLDLFDTVVKSEDLHETFSKDVIKEAFWELLKDCDRDTQVVIAKLIGGDVDFEDGGSNYTIDEYQEKLHQSWEIKDKKERVKFMGRKNPKGHKVIPADEYDELSGARVAQIMEELRSKLEPMLHYYNI